MLINTRLRMVVMQYCVAKNGQKSLAGNGKNDMRHKVTVFARLNLQTAQ